jgi:hypothetical protein
MTRDRIVQRTLPQYPRVVVDEDAIVIINERDERVVWGYEPDEVVADRVAREMEVELRSIAYTRTRIIEFLEELAEEFIGMDLPVGVFEGVIDEAFGDVYRNLHSIRDRLGSRT